MVIVSGIVSHFHLSSILISHTLCVLYYVTSSFSNPYVLLKFSHFHWHLHLPQPVNSGGNSRRVVDEDHLK